MAKPKKTTIGRSELVSFPDWKIPKIHAKVDTGARTSALHVDDIKELPDGRVSFHVVLSKRDPKKRKLITARLLKKAKVRSSSGHYALRCFVKTKVRIGPVEKDIELSLVCRRNMVYRMLLGRKALEKDFLVDVSRRRVLDDGAKADVIRKGTHL